ncbi:hypothetical protein ACFQH6_19590 [Halobacteriaceae archaeon GCM10025711]
MSVETAARDNADWGRTVETHVCDRWNLEHVAGDRDVPDWYDATASTDHHLTVNGVTLDEPWLAAGTPVEVKSCQARVEDGSSTRRGRWWIRKGAHDQLVEVGGEYALAVGGPDTGIHRTVLVSARTVDRLIEQHATWSPTGSSHSAEAAARLPWTAVFAEADLQAGGERA